MSLTDKFTPTGEPVVIESVTPWIAPDDDSACLLSGTDIKISGFADADGNYFGLCLFTPLNPGQQLSVEAHNRCVVQGETYFKNKADYRRRAYEVHCDIQRNHMRLFNQALEHLQQHGLEGFDKAWIAIGENQ